MLRFSSFLFVKSLWQKLTMSRFSLREKKRPSTGLSLKDRMQQRQNKQKRLDWSGCVIVVFTFLSECMEKPLWDAFWFITLSKKREYIYWTPQILISSFERTNSRVSFIYLSFICIFLFVHNKWKACWIIWKKNTSRKLFISPNDSFLYVHY